MTSFLILGCGYAGERVARSLAAEGASVTCTNRQSGSIPGVRCLELDVTNDRSIGNLSSYVDHGARILCSVPAVVPSKTLIPAIRSWNPARMVYLSTTGVYGAAEYVDETSVPDPRDERGALRLKTERALADGPWPTLVLRPGAIYGPDRGVHISVWRGDYSRTGEWNRMVSRIHVDDLADHAVAGLKSDIQGQFPAADDEPCPSSTVAGFAAELIGRVLPAEIGAAAFAGRRVNGVFIGKLLGLGLRYRSYREGVTEAFRSLNFCEALPIDLNRDGAL